VALQKGLWSFGWRHFAPNRPFLISVTAVCVPVPFIKIAHVVNLTAELNHSSVISR